MSSVVELICKKRNRGTYNDEEIQNLIDRITSGEITQCQLGAILMAMFLNGMTTCETEALTRAMISSGQSFTWPSEWKHFTVDKHSTGGVGDKISIILTPALVACGLKVPMITGRGLGFTGGTLDKMESIPNFNVTCNVDQIRNCIQQAGCCITGQTKEIVPVDGIMYACRGVTSTVDCSIISKKAAESISALVLDVKVGKAAFMSDEQEATELAENLVTLAKKIGLNTVAIMSTMNWPIGHYIGNALEVAEAIQGLNGQIQDDVKELVLTLGAHLLVMTNKAKNIDEGAQLLWEQLTNGCALEKFKQLLICQDVDSQIAERLTEKSGDVWTVLPRASFQTALVYDGENGYIHDIDARRLANVCLELGTGRMKEQDEISYSAGLQLTVHVGQYIAKGSTWIIVHHNTPIKEATIQQIQCSFMVKDSPVTQAHTEFLKQSRHEKGFPQSIFLNGSTNAASTPMCRSLPRILARILARILGSERGAKSVGKLNFICWKEIPFEVDFKEFVMDADNYVISDESVMFVDALKKFMKQANLFASQRSDVTLINLEKQLDLMYKCPVSDFCWNSHHLIVTESISSLIFLLNDADITNNVACKILSLLQNWVLNSSFHLLLKTTFQLASVLTSFLARSADKSSEVVIIKCLHLLKVVTCNIQLSNADLYVDDLLKYLLDNILKECPTNEVLVPCMVVLSYICYKNPWVQKKIRNMDGAKYCYRSIINKISSPVSDLLTVAALSTLTSVAFDEEIGSKFFHAKAAIDTLRLVICKISSQDLDVQCLALDILIDLLAKNRIQLLLLQYEYFNDFLMKIFFVLTKESHVRCVCKVYELLWTVGSQPLLQQVVFKALEEAVSTAIGGHPIDIAVYWLSHPPELLWNTSAWAARFIAVFIKSSSNAVHDYLGCLLSAVLDCFTQSYQSQESELEGRLERCTACLELTLCLCQDKNVASKVYSSLGSEFSIILSFLTGNWKKGNYVDRQSVVKDLNGDIADSVLHVLFIMMSIKSSTNAVEEQLYQQLQDVKLIPVLAYALTSQSSDRVQRAFQILFLASQLPDFSRTSLTEAVCQTNQRLNKQQLPNQYGNQFGALNYNRSSSPLNEGEQSRNDGCNTEYMANLVDRFKSSVDVKDVKASEIMELYEHKILSLEMKEKNLLALLDAKANALQQADRVLIEYRSRWTRSDAEALQLRSLLKESERRSENAKEAATKALQETQLRQQDLMKVTEMNRDLMEKNNELKTSCAALHDKIKDQQESISSLSKEISVLSEANLGMKRSRDNFEEKSKKLESLVANLELEKQNTASILKDRDTRVKALKEFVVEMESKIKKSTEAITRLTKEKEALQSEFDRVNEVLREKEECIVTMQSELTQCQTQLDQMNQLTAMIHSMSARNQSLSAQKQ